MRISFARLAMLVGVVLCFTSATFFLGACSTSTTKYPSAFPHPRATQILKDVSNDDISNLHMSMWDVTREKGKPTEMGQYPLDQMTVSLTDAAVKITRPDGSSTIVYEQLGSLRFDPKGTISSEEQLSDAPSHSIVIQIKDGPGPSHPKTEGVPGLFPRAGATKMFETERFTMWDQRFRYGLRITPHLHYGHAAGVFIAEGKLAGVNAKGEPTTPFARYVGQVRYISKPIKAPHEEEGAEREVRAMWLELK